MAQKLRVSARVKLTRTIGSFLEGETAVIASDEQDEDFDYALEMDSDPFKDLMAVYAHEVEPI